MLKKLAIAITVLSTLFIATQVSLDVAGSLFAEQMNVQVREGQLRGKPSFLSPLTGKVSYGERVTILQEKGPWTKIRSGSKTGWIHTSALTDEKLKLAAGSARASGAADQDEVALAGRGFNSEVENEYKSQNPKLQYARIDRMEKQGVSIEEIRSFLESGELQAEGL